MKVGNDTEWNLLRSKWNSCCAGTRWNGRMLLGLLAFACLTPRLPAQAPDGPAAPPPLAIVDGQPITEDELSAADQAQLQRMAVQVYAVKMRAMHGVLDQKLVEAEAKKKGVTPDDLFKTEVLAKVPEPTEEAIRANYESRPELKSHPYDEVKDKIREGLKGVAIQNQRGIYVKNLMQEAINNGELELLIFPPKVEAAADPARLRGDPKAPVTIVEFSDFSCPFCRRAEATMAEILARYPGKVNLSYRDFPLAELHPHAELAAEASRCAGEQGKYWEYHDLLFAAPDKQDRDGLVADARALNLNAEQFDACLASGRAKQLVDKDMQLGTREGMLATPGFFINGTFVSGAQPAATFEQIIDQALSAPGKKAQPTQ